jgi:type I restriction enzyme M protein
MVIKKSQIYSSIRQGCDQLRGGMDAADYKHVVLGLIFLKYICK